MRQSGNTEPQMLNSWKEIAAYLGRGVRTVQRWERDLRLPVHRIGKGKRAPVYATVSELRFWLSTSGVPHAEPLRGKLEPVGQSKKELVENSHRLLSNFHILARTLAENSARHQRQAETLQAHLLQMRSRMKRK